MIKPVSLYIKALDYDNYRFGRLVFGFDTRATKHDKWLLVDPDHIVREHHTSIGKVYAVKRKNNKNISKKNEPPIELNR